MKLIATLSVLTILFSTAKSQTRPAPQKLAFRYIDSLMNTLHIPGLSVAVIVKGRSVWQKALGYADLDNKVKVTTSSRFRIGSVSKSITAMAMARMIDSRMINIDKNIRYYLPDFPDKQHPLTSRQLAGHLSGIRHYRDDSTDYIRKEHYNDVQSSLSIFKNDTLLFVPGSRFSYSTYGYVLLSAVMEKAAKMSFPALLKKNC